jgi:DNA polymerase-1
MSKLLCVADYSQLEPRLMAHFSGDPRMLAIYEEGGAGDIYADMAHGIFGTDWTKDHRGICKTLVLAMGYGAGDKKVGSILTVNGYPTDTATGAAYVAELRGLYVVFFDWREGVIRRVHDTGYVQTIGGRHRRLKAQFVDRRNWKNVGYGERQAVNAIIQGSAADIVRRTMVHTNSDARLADFLLLAQVHDELIWEVEEEQATPERLKLIKWHGEQGHGYPLRVPLGFDPELGASWHEGKEGAPLPLEMPEEFENDDLTLDYEEAFS